jgi:hypothetical protein
MSAEDDMVGLCRQSPKTHPHNHHQFIQEFLASHRTKLAAIKIAAQSAQEQASIVAGIRDRMAKIDDMARGSDDSGGRLAPSDVGAYDFPPRESISTRSSPFSRPLPQAPSFGRERDQAIWEIERGGTRRPTGPNPCLGPLRPSVVGIVQAGAPSSGGARGSSQRGGTQR